MVGIGMTSHDRTAWRCSAVPFRPVVIRPSSDGHCVDLLQGTPSLVPSVVVVTYAAVTVALTKTGHVAVVVIVTRDSVPASLAKASHHSV